MPYVFQVKRLTTEFRRVFTQSSSEFFFGTQITLILLIIADLVFYLLIHSYLILCKFSYYNSRIYVFLANTIAIYMYFWLIESA